MKAYLSNLFDVNLHLLRQVSPTIEWDENCFLIDKWSFMDEVYKSKMYRIDDFPKTIPIEGRHSELEVFFQEDNKLNSYYFEKEKKFLSVLSKLWAYSLAYIESSIFYDTFVPEDCVQKKDFHDVKQLFSQEEIVKIDDWKLLKTLFVWSLRDYVQTCIYLVDLNMIVWIGGSCTVVYIHDKNQENFVRTICTTEGLYLYSKGE